MKDPMVASLHKAHAAQQKAKKDFSLWKCLKFVRAAT